MKKTSKFTKTAIGLLALGILAVGYPRKTERYTAVVKQSMNKAIMITVIGYADDLEGNEKRVGYRGAGVLISPNNHILTCAHLFWMKKISSITVCNSEGECTAADGLAIDNEKDLALLQAFYDIPTPYIKLANPYSLTIGQEVIAIGNPLGLDFSVCHGIISALYRDIGASYNLTQSDVMINPGNSGGPLIDMAGNLVGINDAILPVFPLLPLNTGISLSVQPGQIIEFLTKVRQRYEGLPILNHSYWVIIKKTIRYYACFK